MSTLEATLEAAISNAVKTQNTGSADALDQVGNAILELVSRAAGTAQVDLQEAREVAEKLADQLRATRDQLSAAHHQINGLKADVRHHQDRADRAEKWLQQISSEIEQKLLGAGDRRPVRRLAPEQQEENESPLGLAFLRHELDH